MKTAACEIDYRRLPVNRRQRLFYDSVVSRVTQKNDKSIKSYVWVWGTIHMHQIELIYWLNSLWY